MDKQTLVPVQNQNPQPVQRWIAELAYKDYTARFPGQSLDRLLARGGFGQNELIDHLSRVARDATSEVERLREVCSDALSFFEQSWKQVGEHPHAVEAPYVHDLREELKGR